MELWSLPDEINIKICSYLLRGIEYQHFTTVVRKITLQTIINFNIIDNDILLTYALEYDIDLLQYLIKKYYPNSPLKYCIGFTRLQHACEYIKICEYKLKDPGMMIALFKYAKIMINCKRINLIAHKCIVLDKIIIKGFELDYSNYYIINLLETLYLLIRKAIFYNKNPKYYFHKLHFLKLN